MKRIAIIALLAAALVLSGCWAPGLLPQVSGSGHLETREMDLGGFRRVSAGGTFVIEIVQGDSFEADITADDNLYDYVDVSVSGDTLHLRLQPGRTYRNMTLEARIVMPSLREVELSGASRAHIAGFASRDPLDLDVSGASSLEGEVQAGDVRIEASGASRASLSGSGDDLRLRGSGASATDLGEFSVADADVHLSGASQAVIAATGRLDCDLSGGSNLTYAGDPTLGHISTTGGSSIHPR